MKQNDITSAFDQFRDVVPAVTEVKPPETITAAQSPTPVRAKLNYSEVGVCPYCSQPMRKVICCDQDTYVCDDDRFVSPLPNVEMTGA